VGCRGVMCRVLGGSFRGAFVVDESERCKSRVVQGGREREKGRERL
jgi:hypothetical protein